MKSWLRDIYDNLKINILIEKTIKIRSDESIVSAVLITSAIFSSRPLILNAYLSSCPEYNIKHIRAKLFTLL